MKKIVICMMGIIGLVGCDAREELLDEVMQNRDLFPYVDDIGSVYVSKEGLKPFRDGKKKGVCGTVSYKSKLYGGNFKGTFIMYVEPVKLVQVSYLPPPTSKQELSGQIDYMQAYGDETKGCGL